MSGPRTGGVLIGLALLLAPVAMPGRALAVPAGDEYILRVPHAKGKHHEPTGGETSVSTSPETDAVPRPKHHRPRQRNDSGVATADQAVKAGTTGSTSFVSALFGALLDPLILAALLAVIAIGVGLALRSRRELRGA